MKKINEFISRVRQSFYDAPKLLVPVAFVCFLAIFISIEYVRAGYYQNSAYDYKYSAKVLSVKDTADKLNHETQDSSPAIYCNVEHEDLLQETNEAYKSTLDNSPPEVLISELNSQIVLAGSPPAFNSVAQFIPSVRSARQLSQEMHTATKDLANLTSEDTRTRYCIDLVDVLSEVYFLSSIDSPEGVSALFVGQIENFQINISQAQELIREMTPPKDFLEQHVSLVQLLDVISSDLRSNSNKYQEFSRQIEADVEELESILGAISSKSQDLQMRPSQIAIQANLLE